MLEIIDSTMPVSKQETQRQALLQLWNNGIRMQKKSMLEQTSLSQQFMIT